MKHGPAGKDQTPKAAGRPPQGEDQYRQLTEQLPAITYIVKLRPMPRTTYISPQVLPLLGYTQKEWLAKPDFWIQQLDPMDSERVLGKVRQHNQTGEAFFLEYRVRAKDGRTVWIRNSATYQRDKTGRTTAVHGVMQDITARKQAEEWLNALNNRMLSFGSDVTANINALVAMCGKTMEATCALYNRLDSGLLCSRGQWQTPPGFQASDQPEGHICYDVIQQSNDQPLVVRNLPATPYAQSDRNVAAYGLQTYVGMAVKCRGRPVGAVCVVYQRDVDPAPEQLDYMRVVSLAIAIEEERKAAEQLLTRSKQDYKKLSELFRSVADVMPDMLWAKDLDQKYLFANRALCERLLCTRDPEEPIGKTDLFFAQRERQAHPDNPQWHTFGENCADSDSIVIRSGQTRQFDEVGNVRGRCLHLDVIKTPLRNEKGEMIGTVGTARDITERKRAEEALRKSEERFRALFEESAAVKLIIDPDTGKILSANKAAAAFYGWPIEELRRMRIQEINLLPPDAVRIEMERVKVSGSKVFRFPHRRADGSVREVEVFSSKMELGGKTVLYSIIQDVTERKRAEDKLRESEKLLAESQGVAGLGSYALDIQTGAWESSRMLDTLFGIDQAYAHTVAGWEELLHPDDRTLMTDYLRDEVRGQGRPFDKEYRILRPDDRAVRWVHGLGKLECDARGKPVRMIGTIQDITARKEAEIERAALETDLHQAQKMESVGRLAGGVAHDFNNILQAILGNVELALDQTPPDSPIRRDLEEVQNASRRAADLVRQLLAFARKQTVAPRSIDLNQTVENILEMLRRLIGNEIKLVWSPAPDLWPVRMDPSQTDQILANLCVNARDALSGSGEVHLETRNTHVDELHALRHEGFSPGDYVLLMVSDTGCGIGKETQERIFEPFFTTKDMGKGTGLGLSTVYGIVRQNQGHIAVYSEPGQGTTFRIYLPRFTDSAAAPAAKAPAPSRRQGHEILLLVEDDPAILRLTSRFIEQEGYTVLAANTPEDALRLAREHAGKIHLLLTDIVMPGMNGRELSERMKALYPELKCLFMSGYTANIIARQGMLEGGVHFIQKPFSQKELFEKIRAILDGPPAGRKASQHR